MVDRRRLEREGSAAGAGRVVAGAAWGRRPVPAALRAAVDGGGP